MQEQPTRRFGPSYDSRSIKASILLTRISMIALVLTLAATAACATQQHERACAGQILADKIIELQNYTLLPSRRDTLISLFEREFIETQEAVGARIVGTFRDLNAPDHFVWIRCFKDLDTRALALTAFYNGPAWHAHSKAANATMIDTDNVHMLHSVGAPLCMPSARPALDAPGTSQSLIVIDVYALRGHTEEELRALAIRDPAILAMLSTEGSPNNFPALPVRSDSVFATIRRFDAKRETIPRIQQLPEPEQTLRLRPTSRSLLR